MNVLGVLGGMGPMATVDFMGKVVRLTAAVTDQDHIPMIVHSAVAIPDRIAGLRGTGPSPFPAMLATLRLLERAGATVVAIPCNTAHFWHPQLQAETSIPILHIVDAVAEALVRDGVAPGRIGLLATSATLEAAIYEERLAATGFACVAPDEGGQQAVVRAIALVKAGRFTEAGGIVRPRVEALMAAGCHRVVLACTEMPLALSETDDLRHAILDATDALAAASVLALGYPLAVRVV